MCLPSTLYETHEESNTTSDRREPRNMIPRGFFKDLAKVRDRLSAPEGKRKVLSTSFDTLTVCITLTILVCRVLCILQLYIHKESFTLLKNTYEALCMLPKSHFWRNAVFYRTQAFIFNLRKWTQKRMQWSFDYNCVPCLSRHHNNPLKNRGGNPPSNLLFQLAVTKPWRFGTLPTGNVWPRFKAIIQHW